MRILMTGLTSFTGGHLLPLVQEAGWELYPLIRKSSGFKNEIIWDFLSPLPSGIPSCDAVVHLAADIDFADKFNLDLYRVNTLATAKLVSYAQARNAYFVFASSIAVHGAADNIGPETPIETVNQYGASKFIAEEIIQSFLNKYAILRISGIYGLNGPKHLGLNKTIKDALYDHVVPVLKGAGNVKRNYICVLDVARWIFTLLKEYETKSETGKNIYYLSDSENRSLRAYLEAIVHEFIPGEAIKLGDGSDGRDCIVESSPASFPLTKFSDYLKIIKNKDYVIS